MDTQTLKRIEGDLNSTSLNFHSKVQDGKSSQSMSNQDDKSYKTDSLSFLIDPLVEVKAKEIIEFYDQFDQGLFDDILNQTLIFSERKDYYNISQVQNQRILIQYNDQSQVFSIINVETNQLVVFKQSMLYAQEIVLQKLDDYIIHSKVYRKFQNQCLQLITPVLVGKEGSQSFFIKSQLEKAQFNLYDYSRKYQITTDQVHHILFQLIQQLVNMHSINIAHRDVKPQNIFYVIDKGWLLSDFGESSEYQNVEDYYQIRGTLYFLIPQLKQHAQKRDKLIQNLLNNDLYALVITIIMIQRGEYIKDITQEINQTNDPIINKILNIKSLNQLELFLESNRCEIQSNCSFDYSMPIYRALNDKEIKINEKLVYESWISLCNYFSGNEKLSALKSELCQLIQYQLMYNKQMNNCEILNQIYCLKDLSIQNQFYKLYLKYQLKVDKLSRILKKREKNKQIFSLKNYLNILFIQGFNEKIIHEANEILNIEYYQDVHMLLIKCYERIQGENESEQQFIVFNQNLLFDKLNTQNQGDYVCLLETNQNDYLICNNFQSVVYRSYRQGTLFQIDQLPKLYQFLEPYINNEDKNKILDIIMKYINQYCRGAYSRQLDKFFIQLFDSILKFSIEIYKNFIIQILQLQLEVVDRNRLQGFLNDLCEIYILQNDSEQFRKTLKMIKQLKHDPDSQQQLKCLSMSCLALRIKSKVKQSKIQDYIQRVCQQIPYFRINTYKRYQLIYAQQLVKFINFFYQNKKMLTNIKSLRLIIQYLHHIEYQTNYRLQFQSILSKIWGILQYFKNQKRSQLLVNSYDFCCGDFIKFTKKILMMKRIYYSIKQEFKFNQNNRSKLGKKFMFYKYFELGH